MLQPVSVAFISTSQTAPTLPALIRSYLPHITLAKVGDSRHSQLLMKAAALPFGGSSASWARRSSEILRLQPPPP